MEGRFKAIARGVEFRAKPKPTRLEIAEHYGITRPSLHRQYTENRPQYYLLGRIVFYRKVM